MDIIEYFASENKEHWIKEIDKSGWAAAKFLVYLLRENKLKELTGETARLLLLTQGDKLVSFCTLAPRDEIDTDELHPWIGFVFTFEEFRGQRCAGKLLGFAEKLAKENGAENIYISTDHVGLYEKYGYEFMCIMENIRGEDCRVYTKKL